MAGSGAFLYSCGHRLDCSDQADIAVERDWALAGVSPRILIFSSELPK
jgi:hypothetical protein